MLAASSHRLVPQLWSRTDQVQRDVEVYRTPLLDLLPSSLPLYASRLQHLHKMLFSELCHHTMMLFFYLKNSVIALNALTTHTQYPRLARLHGRSKMTFLVPVGVGKA